MARRRTGSPEFHPCILGSDDAGWPRLWRELPDPPRRITVSGDATCLGSRSLAIVGTRRATARGLAVASHLAGAMVRCGWVIVSGMAAGVDAAAHRGALAAGGRTVAVMGTGIDRTYPARHAGLRARIERSGCVLTELDRGMPPLKHHFPLRNRLIAGLAEGVIVVDAPRRSGALLTAFLALDFGREVFAVPGPVDMYQSMGCHHLLKQGAVLVDSVEDVHRVLTPPSAGADGDGAPALPLPAPGSAARWIWDRLDLEGVSLGELEERWCGTMATWSEGLAALDLAGLIRRLPGGMLARSIWVPTR